MSNVSCVPGTCICDLQSSRWFIKIGIISLLLQIRRLRHRAVTWFAPGHIGKKWQSWGFNLGLWLQICLPLRKQMIQGEKDPREHLKCQTWYSYTCELDFLSLTLLPHVDSSVVFSGDRCSGKGPKGKVWFWWIPVIDWEVEWSTLCIVNPLIIHKNLGRYVFLSLFYICGNWVSERKKACSKSYG